MIDLQYAACYVATKQNGKRLKDKENMEYSLNQRWDIKTFYKCYIKACKVSAAVDNETETIKREHNHDSVTYKAQNNFAQAPNTSRNMNKNMCKERRSEKPSYMPLSQYMDTLINFKIFTAIEEDNEMCLVLATA